MTYAVRIYDNDHIKDIYLTGKKQYSIGSSEKDDYQIAADGLDLKQVVLTFREGKWYIQGGKNIFFNGELVTGNEIKPGDIYTIGIRGKLTMWVYETAMEPFQKIDLMNFEIEEISFGRSNKCGISFRDKRVSGNHAKLYRYENSWHLCDMASTNGTFVNGVRIQDISLKQGDQIQFATYSFIFTESTLIIRCSKEIAEIQKKFLTRDNECSSKNGEIPYREYPNFNMSPRLKKEIPRGEIEIESPPSISMTPDINWMSVLLPPLAMVAIMAGIVIFTEGNQMSLYYTAPMCLLSILVSITTYQSQKKKHKKREQLRLKKYEEHIKEKVKEIQEKRKQQIEALTLTHPSTPECFNIVENIKRRMWERQFQDKDFMDVRIGLGAIDFSVDIKIPKLGIVLEEDLLLTKPGEVRETYKTLEQAPIVLRLAQAMTCGLVGERTDVLNLAKNMVVQITTHHCYDEVKLVTVFSKEEARSFDWIKWLPHSFDDNRNERYMADDAFSSAKLFRNMEEVLSQREKALKEERNTSRKERKHPYYLFIIGEKSFIEDQSIMRYLTANEPDMGLSALFLFDEIGSLPKECSVIIEVKQGQGSVYNKENIAIQQRFQIDNTQDHDFEQFSRKLLPVRVAAGIEEKLLPNCITFLEGYGVKRPQEINLEANWTSALTYKSMSVPIGIKANGEDFYFDIHEKKYGPHGLVAGMTGSGKSEMVQSWILSMALKFSPKDVSFVLIDFKGTGLILPFLNMPHLAGTISDLDTNINRNLIALENELSRRKALLDEAGVNNISAYLKAYKDGKVSEPLSFLFIVIDEFAEFKVQFPDFMTVINRVFAIGRTLGVFAILLTQKPSGVVDDKMHANTRFRWCLKVASSADSKDMLRHSDAARITVPGRAYVQVGEDEVYELVQSYWSGAPYDPEKKKSSSVKPTISLLGIGGERIAPLNQEKSVGIKSETNEIDVIVEYLASYAKEHQGLKARKIWEPKMPSYIPLPDIIGEVFNGKKWPDKGQDLTPVIGLIDDPHSQRQYPLQLDISSEGHIAVYGAPGTGKTTLLQTLVMSVCMCYMPDSVSIYIMDFGGWSMNIFKEYPHVGGIANDNEPEKIIKLARLISKAVEKRKYSFAEAGVGNIFAYREATGEKVPYILLIIDNFAPVLNLYPELEDFFIKLTREGGNYGIYLIATANSTMALGFKLVQNIKMALALQMTDRTDYASIVGKTGGLEPENYEGRGLVKGTHPLEFQAALPVGGKNDSDRISKIRAIADRMNRSWNGDKAKPIPIMPEMISFGSISGQLPAIGLTLQDVEPVYAGFAENHYLIVSGRSGSGKSNMLQVIAKQTEACRRILFDGSDRALSGLESANDLLLETGEAFDQAIADMIPLLQGRRERYLQNGKQIFEPILIIIDDLKLCFDSVSDETARRLDAIIRLGKGLNVNLLVAGNCEDIRKMYNQGEPFTMGLVNGTSAILLGGSYNDHSCFKANIPYSEANITVGEHEGFYLEREKAVRFKAMYCK